MTLYQLLWTIFDVDPQVGGFVQKIQEKLSEAEETASLVSTDTSIVTKRGGRLNTKLRSQNTMQDINIGDEQSHINSFWDRNFESDEEVPWYKFQKCFLDDYETQLSSMLRNPLVSLQIPFLDGLSAQVQKRVASVILGSLLHDKYTGLSNIQASVIWLL